MADDRKPISSSAAVRHLLISFPEDTGATEPHAVLDQLVLGSLAELASDLDRNGPFSREEVTRRLHEVVGLAFESNEVKNSVGRLVELGKAAYTDRDGHSITIEPNAKRTLHDSSNERRSLEERVKKKWIDQFLDRWETLDYVHGEEAWKLLRAALAHLTNSRSAEAAAFLYMDREEARLHFESILNEPRGVGADVKIPSFIPRSDFLGEVALFIQTADEDRTDYLLNLLNAAFRYHLVSLDPGASRLVRSVVGSKIFYVDTNFLFRLLAIHGPRQAHAPALLVNLAEELSTDMRVSRATLDEFRSTVRYRSQELRQFILERDDFRRIAAGQATTDIDFMGQFYREWQSGQISGVDEFEGKYMQVERAIDDWNITVDDELTWDEELVAALSGRSQELYRWHGGERSASSCDHDILMEHYVRALRSNSIGGMNDVDVWFLTYDRRLTRFAYANPHDMEAPFPLLAEDWFQIVRSFSPRTQEYDRAFLALLASPLLVDDRAVPFPQVVNALKRLERYEGLSERVVAGMIAEQEFVKTLSRTEDPEDEAELVKLEVARVASNIEKDLESTEAEKARLERARDKLLVEQDDLRTRQVSTENRLEQLAAAQDQLRLERDAATEQNEDLRDVAAELRTEVKLLRAGLSILIGLVLVAAVAISWDEPLVGDSTEWRVFLVLSSAAVVLCTATGIWARRHVRSPFFWIGVLTLAGAIAQLLLS